MPESSAAPGCRPASPGSADAAARLPVGTSPVFSAPVPPRTGWEEAGGAHGAVTGPSAEAPERAGQGSGVDLDEPANLGGSEEYRRAVGQVHRLGHDDYHALVRARMADLDRLDPARERLVPSPGLVVALDVDGTILDVDGRVSERMMASIARMRHYGAAVVISTGRGIQAAAPVAHHVGLTDGWMVCANGALTLRMNPALPGGYEVVSSQTFDPAPAIDALLAAVPDGILAVEDLERGFCTSAPFPPGELIEDQTVVSLDQLRSRPVTRVILRAPGMDLEDFSAAVRGAGLHSVEYAIGWTAWLDVAPDGVTKATALDRLVHELGTDASRTIAVGDGTNDVEMLTWAGAGVAMGSAPASVREQAAIVTAPVWQDGCAAVLDAVVERVRA